MMDDTQAENTGVVDIAPITGTDHHQRMSLLEEIEANLGSLSADSGMYLNIMLFPQCIILEFPEMAFTSVECFAGIWYYTALQVSYGVYGRELGVHAYHNPCLQMVTPV